MDKIFVAVAAALYLSACGQGSAVPKNLTAESARYEAQKIAVALTARAGSAAFMDAVLKDDAKYREIFTDGLKPMIDRAPVSDPAFSRYKPCVESGVALLKFAELRKLAGRQDEESDKYRRPYWDSLAACQAAIN